MFFFSSPFVANPSFEGFTRKPGKSRNSSGTCSGVLNSHPFPCTPSLFSFKNINGPRRQFLHRIIFLRGFAFSFFSRRLCLPIPFLVQNGSSTLSPFSNQAIVPRRCAAMFSRLIVTMPVQRASMGLGPLFRCFRLFIEFSLRFGTTL